MLRPRKPRRLALQERSAAPEWASALATFPPLPDGVTAPTDALADEGVEATVWDVRSVKPLDPEMISDAAGHPLVFTIEDGYRHGGAGSMIATEISDSCTGTTGPRVEILGIPTTYIDHANVDDILRRFGLDADGIADTVRRSHAVHARSLS